MRATPAYEGEAAVLLEAAISDASLGRKRTVDPEAAGDAYHMGISKIAPTPTAPRHDTSVISARRPARILRACSTTMAAGVATSAIARKFHDAMVEAIMQACLVANAAYGISTVALSGGVFMNRYLLEHTLAALETAGFTVALNKELPCNDGGVSFGQAVIAAARHAGADAQK